MSAAAAERTEEERTTAAAAEHARAARGGRGQHDGPADLESQLSGSQTDPAGTRSVGGTDARSQILADARSQISAEIGGEGEAGENGGTSSARPTSSGTSAVAARMGGLRIKDEPDATSARSGGTGGSTGGTGARMGLFDRQRACDRLKCQRLRSGLELASG